MTPATVEAARRVLPLWVIWLPLAAPLLAAAVAYALASLGAALAARGLRRLPADAHWTERARGVFAVRKVVLTAGLVCILLSAFLRVGGPVSVGSAVAVPLSALAALAATLSVSFRTENRLVGRIFDRDRFGSFAARLLVVLSGFVASLLAVALGLPHLDRVGVLGAVAALGLLAAGFTFGGGLLLARGLGLVGPAPERLRAAFARVSPAGARPPRLLRISILSANTVALPWLGAVLFTDGALAILDDEQLAAVLAHELEHLREPWPVAALRIALAAILPVVLPAAIVMVRHPGQGIVAALAALVAALLLVRVVLLAFRPVQRAMERRSDAAGHAASPAYAAALELIYEQNLLPAVLRRKASHPDLFERMAAAGAPPAWQRPSPPPAAFGAMLPIALALAVLGAGGAIARERLLQSDDGEAGWLRAVALRGGANDLGWLAFARYAEGKVDEALPLLRAAHELAPREPGWPAWEAIALSNAGRCEEARASLEIAAAIDGGGEAVQSAARYVPTCIPR